MNARLPSSPRHAALLATALALCLVLLLAGCATTPPAPTETAAELQRQVADTERAFARSMADRDLAAFTALLADDAVFFTGPKPLHGKEAVTAAWKRFYERPQAPFSWAPETVEVLGSGTLALSTGPVYDPAGRKIATFTSIWRRQAPGQWRIVFDKGDDGCDCAKSP